MDWHGDREISRALVRVRTDPHIVVFRFNIQASGSHGNSLHAFSAATASGFFAIPAFGLDSNFLYVCAFYGNAAAHQVSAKCDRTRWISKRNVDFILRPHWLGQCEQSRCDWDEISIKLKVIVHV